MSLIDTREISKVKIMMVGGGGGSDAATLAGIGKKVSVSNKTITTDIDLFRAPKEGDRLLVFFDDLVDDPDTMIVYNDGTPVSISLVGEMIPLDYYLNGLCVFQLKTNFITSTPYWDLIERSEGVSYTAGTGIDIINGTIRNTLPQLGDNSQCKSVDSVTQGRLGSYSGDVKYLLIHFDTDAEPYSGAYSLVLSYSGSVAVTKYGALYDRVMSMEYDREIYSGSTLLCEIMDDGTGTQADPVHVDVLGTIDGYVTAGWGRQAALGDRATAEGIGTEASGNYAHAHGYQTAASGNQSTAMGYSTTASADGATAMGNGTTASGANSIAGGYNTTASGAVSTAIGTNTQATQQAQLAAGKYNKTNNDALVMVGNGTGASARSNALEVLLNGDVVAGNEIIDGQGNTLSVLAEALTKTASGNPVVIDDCAGGKARSLKTTIEAIQDLHGYDKPWAGGAGKNLFDKDATGIVNNAAIASDGTTTPYDRWSVSDYIPVDATADYAYSNVRISDTSSAICAFYDSSKAHISNSAQAGATRVYTTPANTAFVRFEFYTSASNTMMFEKGSTASTYEPYSNICPISGRTETSILDRGKNMVDIDNAVNYEKYSGGVRNGFEFSGCKGTYTISQSVTVGNVYYAYQTAGGTWAEASLLSSTLSATLSNVDGKIQIWVASGETIKSKSPYLQLEQGKPATPYEEYKGHTLTIALGQTVYGAEINWDTGVMTVKTAKQTLDSDLTWVRGGGGSIPTGRAVYYFTEGLTGAKPCGNDDNSNNITMKSNVYNIANKSYNAMRLETGFALGIGGDSNSSTIGCNVSSTDIPDASAFETWLDSNPIQIEYPLATPTTLQLTPTQLEMLKGYNRVSIEDGSIELGYIAKLT